MATKIIENTLKRVIFLKKTGKMDEKWFGTNDCSNYNLLKQCEREGEVIDRIQFYDTNGIGDELHVYFKKTEGED